MHTETRLTDLERTTNAMGARLAALERALAPVPPTAVADPTPPAAVATPTPAPVAQRRTTTAASRLKAGRTSRNQPSLEDLLAGRVLAWGGGAAVLIGIALLFGIAVSRGWIGAPARVIIASALAFAMGAVGVWLHEHKGRTDAALAAIATSVAALFVCDIVAVRGYDLIPATVGMTIAIGIGAAATVLAVRWRAQGIAALGLCGALLAPVLAGVGATSGSLAFLLIAAACATAVCIHERWSWLGAGVLAITAPQWITWALNADPSPLSAVLWMTGFAVLGLTAAIGYELRDRDAGLRSSAIYLVAANALLMSVVGGIVLTDISGHTLANCWIVALAVAHLGLGLGLRHASRPVRGLLIAIGVLLADVAAGLILGGPALTIAWVSGSVIICLVSCRLHGHELVAAQVGLAGQLAAALVQALAGGSALGAATGPDPLDIGTLVSVIVVAAGCFTNARLTAPSDLRRGLEIGAMALLALITAMTLDGTALVIAWSIEAVGFDRAARRGDPVARLGSLAFLGLAGAHALGVEAPPTALITGAPDALDAAAALGALIAATVTGAYLLRAENDDEHLKLMRVGLGAAAALLALYLGSVELISAFQPGSGVETDDILPVRQLGQMLLSGGWALVGLGLLIAGLRRSSLIVRRAGLALLALAMVKVAVFDLATLDSFYRVISFVALGLLLLVGAFVWQRARPRPLPDLRQAPPAFR